MPNSSLLPVYFDSSILHDRQVHYTQMGLLLREHIHNTSFCP